MILSKIIITPGSEGKTRREALAIAQWLYATNKVHKIGVKKIGSYSIELYHPFESPEAFKTGFFDKVFRRKHPPKPLAQASASKPEPLAPPSRVMSPLTQASMFEDIDWEILSAAKEPLVIEPQAQSSKPKPQTQAPAQTRKTRRRAKTPKFR